MNTSGNQNHSSNPSESKTLRQRLLGGFAKDSAVEPGLLPETGNLGDVFGDEKTLEQIDNDNGPYAVSADQQTLQSLADDTIANLAGPDDLDKLHQYNQQNMAQSAKKQAMSEQNMVDVSSMYEPEVEDPDLSI